jgi:hypothetical protein
LDDKIIEADICVHLVEFELFGKYKVYNNTFVFRLIFVLGANIFKRKTYIFLKFLIFYAFLIIYPSIYFKV